MPKIIKQYGLERSGTNYIKALIELNSDAIVLSILFGGKHDKYSPITKNFDPFGNKWVVTDLSKEQILQIKDDFLNDNIYYLISIKNPYSWVVSYRKFYKKHIKIDKDFIPLHDISTKGLIQHWNKLNNDWINNLSHKNFYIVNYDKLIKNPSFELKNIFNKFSINGDNSFLDINNDMLEGPDTHGSKNISDKKFNKRNYYINSEYLSKLSRSDIKIIEKCADKELLKLIG